MTPWILAVLALWVLHTLLPGSFRYLTGDRAKLLAAMGSRDRPPEMPVLGARAERARVNLQEALPVFLSIALLLEAGGVQGGQASAGAALFLGARVLYLPAYLSGIPGPRSAIWMLSWVGLAAMIGALPALR